MSLNRTTIIGYLEQDPQLRFTPLGNPVCTLSVATDESYTNKETGERKEGVEWHRVLRTTSTRRSTTRSRRSTSNGNLYPTSPRPKGSAG
jgi:single stranded DNA-binding protein